jgi:hypothetical protein
LRKSSSGSYITVIVNCRHICITSDTYPCVREEGRKWDTCTPLCRPNPVLFNKVNFRITVNRNWSFQRCLYYLGHISLCKRGMRKWVKCTPLCRQNPVLFEKFKFGIKCNRKAASTQDTRWLATSVLDTDTQPHNTYT